MLAVLALFILGFPLAAWVGSALPVNSDWSPPAHGVEIMVETNGFHTGIVVPLATPQKDWREDFPSASQPRPDGYYPTHLGIGWGERDVFLSVPTWGDLKPGTALRILTSGGDALMRVSPYVRPRPSKYYRPITISEQQYALLVAAIERALPTPAPGTIRQSFQSTYSQDAYYTARGDYTLTHTCNSWVGETLAEAGIKMGWWTPFAGGVMKWIPPPVQSH